MSRFYPNAFRYLAARYRPYSRVVMSPVLLLTIASFSLSACVFSPTRVDQYNSDCGIVNKRYELTLEEYQALPAIGPCSDKGCAGAAAVSIFIAVMALPLSAVVSGSIVVIGNSIFWLEEKGKCDD